MRIDAILQRSDFIRRTSHQLDALFPRGNCAVGLLGRVLVVDNSATAPAFHLADQAWTVPSCNEVSFIDRVMELALREGVNLIVPTIDPELPVYARHRERFLAKASLFPSVTREPSKSPLTNGIRISGYRNRDFHRPNRAGRGGAH